MGWSSSLLEEFSARRSATARHIRDTLVQQVPAYAALPAAEHSGLLVEELHHSLGRALELADEDRPHSEADLDFFRAIGERRGRAGFPLAEFTAAFELSLVVALRSCWDLVSIHNYPDMLHLTQWTEREVLRTQQAAVQAYSTARRLSGDPRAERSLVIKQLLAGSMTAAGAAAVGYVLPRSYVVMLWSVPYPDLVDCEQTEDVVRHLEALSGVLFQGEPARMLVLLPVDTEPRLADQVAEEVVAFIASRTGQQVRAAQSHRMDLVELPDAVTEASHVLTLVAAMPDAANRPYRMDELLVELAIARQPDLGRRLADQLDRLQRGAALPQTLAVLCACNLNREQAAKVLHIHRRTLTYRLGRVRELTGIDPGTAHGIQLLRAMLTARRLVGVSVPPGESSPVARLRAAPEPIGADGGWTRPLELPTGSSEDLNRTPS